MPPGFASLVTPFDHVGGQKTEKRLLPDPLVDRTRRQAHILCMRFRLSFAEVPDADPKFWSKRLKAHGITVMSSRESGIDAEGKIDDIERALGTTIKMLARSQPRFGEVSVREPGKRAPLAYVPREPTYF